MKFYVYLEGKIAKRIKCAYPLPYVNITSNTRKSLCSALGVENDISTVILGVVEKPSNDLHTTIPTSLP